MMNFPRLLILLLLSLLAACSVNVTHTPAGSAPAAMTATSEPVAPSSAKPVTTFSRHMLVTFERRRMPRVDREYLQLLVAPPLFHGLRLEQAGFPAQPRQLWRVDGLHSQAQFFALMESISHRPEVLAVEGTRGVAPVVELKPLLSTPKPTEAKSKTSARLNEVELILGMEANSLPPVGELLEVFAEHCLHEGEVLEYRQALAGNAHLIKAKLGGNAERLQQLQICLGRQKGVRFVEQNRRYRLLPNGGAVTPPGMRR